MIASGKNGSKTAPSRKPGKAKPARPRTAKSSPSRKAGASRKASAAASSGKPERLSAGGLDPLVLDYLEKNKATAPHGPSKIAKGLGRSSGAISNCLVRLTGAKKTKRVSDKPAQYDLAV